MRSGSLGTWGSRWDWGLGYVRNRIGIRDGVENNSGKNHASIADNNSDTY